MKRKTRITFRKISLTQVQILLDKKVVGDIWSELNDGDSPHNDCHRDMIQMCGIIGHDSFSSCGRFKDKGDLTARFKEKEE